MRFEDRYFTSRRQDVLRRSVQAFAEQQIRPRIAEMEATRTAHVELSRMIARQGWIGATVPAAYGGMAVGHVGKTVVIEELSRVSGAMGAMAQASQLGAAKIIHFGSEDQKRRWLPAIAAGECLPTIAVTESESGGHVLGMTSTAVRDGDEYILDGRKVYVGNSHVGDLHGVVMRTGAGSRGLTAFLVEADNPGLSLVPQQPAMGLHGFSFGELIFDNCRVPVANRLGAEGDGLAVAARNGGPVHAAELDIPVEGGALTGLDFGGHGPGVLLVHGSGHNAAVWIDVAARLVDRCRPIAVDLRGHGRNRLDSDDAEQYWRDLGAVLAALSWERPVLVGHSTGGYAVAAATASGLAAPAAVCVVDGVVLDDRASSLDQQAALRSAETAEQLRRTFRYGWRADDTQLQDYVELSVREAGTDWLNAGARAGLVETVVRRSFVRHGSHWVRRPTIEEIAAVTDVRPGAAVLPSKDLYDRIRCPMAIVHATDGFYAARRGEVEAVVAQHPARRLAVIDGNHNVPMTHPDELADVILDLVAEHASPAGRTGNFPGR